MSALKARKQYLVEVGPSRPASGDKPSASKVYRHRLAKDAFPNAEFSTLHDLFQRSVARFAAEPLLGWRPVNAQGGVGEYQWITYAETGARVAEVASGLAGLGVTAGQRVGVYGVNCPEWMIAMQVSG
jgi:long-chain acyl-CoA synthetase